jgi:hypothetical protein
MKQQSCWGILWFFKRPQVRPLEKQRNWQHNIWCLRTNTWANRVANVSSVIRKILNPRKHWTVTIQPSVWYVQWISVYCCQFSVTFHLLFDFHSLLFCFVQSVLFDYSVFNYLFIQVFSVLVLELYSRYFDPHNNNHLASHLTSYIRQRHLLS